MNVGVEYCEHPATVALRPWLDCIWVRGGNPDGPVRVLPDGCIDIVWTRGTGTLIVGANTTAFQVGIAPGIQVVGARLRPGAAPPLLGVEPEQLRDVRVPVQELLGDRGTRLAAALDDDPDPASRLDHWLHARAAQAELPDRTVAAAVARLSHSADRVGALAGELGCSERALRRRVRAAIGYGPKRLGRVLRLQRALEAARGGEELSAVAFGAGYADQAHFTHDCCELAGLPPSALLAT